jgi:nucleoside-diphosphate-sugar epimerase
MGDQEGRAVKYFITGAAGFIGSHLAEKALADGHTVIGMDCYTDYYPRSFKERNIQTAQSASNYTFIHDNLLEADLQKLFDGVDVIFHLAAQAGVRASWGNSFRIYSDLNVLGTQCVLEAARDAGVKRVVYASSSSVYGDAEAFPTCETAAPQPVSPYGVTKLAGEHLCRLYTKNFGLPTVSLRYFTVFGPRQRPDMAFHIFIKNLLRNERPVIFGNGEQTRDFTFVGDVVDATYAAATANQVEGKVFNIGGGSRVTLARTVEILCSLTGRPCETINDVTQKGDVRHTSADIRQAGRYLGYSPRVTLEEGLAQELAWLKTVYDNQQNGGSQNGSG